MAIVAPTIPRTHSPSCNGRIYVVIMGVYGRVDLLIVEPMGRDGIGSM